MGGGESWEGELVAMGKERESSWQVGRYGLHVAMVGAGGQSVARLPTICAKPGLKTEPALLKGESSYHCQQLLIVDRVIEFSSCKLAAVEADRV